MSVYVNWTAVPGPVLIPHSTNDVLPPQRELSASERDGVGAGYYVIVVILVYGMSIVALIASHIKRKHSKLLEDRQIHKYLKEFQVVRETSSRDNYRSLKRSIIDKLSRGNIGNGGGNQSFPTMFGGRRRSSSSGCSSTSIGSVQRCLNRAVLPLTAPLGLPANVCSVDLTDELICPPPRRRQLGRRGSGKLTAPAGSAPVAAPPRHRLERRRHALRAMLPATPPSSPQPVCDTAEVADSIMADCLSPPADDPCDWPFDWRSEVARPAAYFTPGGLVIHVMCPRCHVQLESDARSSAIDANAVVGRDAARVELSRSVSEVIGERQQVFAAEVSPTPESSRIKSPPSNSTRPPSTNLSPRQATIDNRDKRGNTPPRLLLCLPRFDVMSRGEGKSLVPPRRSWSDVFHGHGETSNPGGSSVVSPPTPSCTGTVSSTAQVTSWSGNNAQFTAAIHVTSL